MKIVHLLGWYFPESVGGTEVYVAALARDQRKRGHDVSVAAPIAGGTGASRYMHDDIEVFRYPIPDRPSKMEAQGRAEVRGTSFLREYLSELKADIAHFHTVTTGLGLDEMITAKRLGARVVMTSHLPATGYVCIRGTLMQWGEYMSDGIASPVKCAACMLQERGLSKSLSTSVAMLGSLPGLSTIASSTRAGTALGMTDLVRFRMAQQRIMINTIDRFVLLNKRSLRIATDNGAPREKLALNYLGHGFNDVSKKPSVSEKPTELPLTIGYVGRLAGGKGLEVLISAIESLPNDVPIQFEIRGRANDDVGRAIATQVSGLAARRANVRLEPPVAPERVAEIMSSYDVLCVPSSSFENGPTVVSEAHAVGTPVIGTNIGAMPELIPSGTAGLIVAPGDSQALADGFLMIARDPATIDRWRDNLPPARTMREIADDYEAMYREILSS